MTSEEDIYCSKCNNKTEQALMLSCDHNLCLSCASKTLDKQQIKDINTSQYIKCDICNNLTELEPETIKQILFGGNENNQNNEENYVIDNLDSNYFLDLEENNNNNNNINQHFKNIISNSSIPGNQDINNKINQYNNNQKNNGENNNITSSEINIINDLINNNKNKCKEHGELLSYLCLDCMSNCVCSECVVHGIHRNHEVLNIKKAYPLIYNKMQDLSKYVNDQIKEVTLINETITKKKNFIKALIDRCKNEIHNTFEQIRIRLDNKEKEIINNSTNILVKSINELNNYNNLIQKKMTTLGSLIDQINNIINTKNEFSTIDYFCENKNIILAQAELNEINNLTDLETFTNIKIEPDKITLNKMLDGMNNFHFNIININGIDIPNRVQLNSKRASENNLNSFQNNNKINNIYNNNNNNINQNQYFNNNQLIPKNNYMNQRQKGINQNNQKRRRQINNINNNNQFNNMRNFKQNFNQNMDIMNNNNNQNFY